MITTELEKKITLLSTDYIYNQSVNSLLLLLLSCMEDNENAFSKEIDTTLLDIKKEIRNQVSALKITLSDNDVKACAAETLLSTKKSLLAVYKDIYCYFAKWNTIFTLATDNLALRKYKNEKNSNKSVDYAAFYSDCIEFLRSAENMAEEKVYIGQLFKCIPFKMVRDKYYTLLEKSLLIALAEQSRSEITITLETFKNTCAPESGQSYGKHFPHIALALKESEERKPSLMSDEELDCHIDNLKEVFELLSDIEIYCQEILDSINSLLILFTLNFTFDDITEKNYSYSDIYCKVCEVMENPKDTAFNETIIAMLEDYIEPSLDTSNELAKKEMNLIKKIEDLGQLSEETIKTLATEDLVRGLFHSDINDEIFQLSFDSVEETADIGFIKTAVAGFIAFMRNYYESLSTPVRKSSMQLLLSSLPLPMDLDQCMEYIKDGVDNATTFEEGLLILDKIGTVFDEYNFDYKTEEEHQH